MNLDDQIKKAIRYHRTVVDTAEIDDAGDCVADQVIALFCNGCDSMILRIYKHTRPGSAITGEDPGYHPNHDYYDHSLCTCGDCNFLKDENVPAETLIKTVCRAEDYRGFEISRPLGHIIGVPRSEEIQKTKVENEARKLLDDPQLFQWLVDAVEVNVKLDTRLIKEVLTVGLSFLTEDPQNLIISHNASTGKTFGVLETVKVFPDIWINKLHNPSPKSLFNFPGEWLDDTNRLVELNQIQVILEGKESEEFLDQIKPIMSHDDTEVKVPTVMKVKGKNTTVTTTVKGLVPWIVISAKKMKNMETSSRAWISEPNATPEKYEAAIKSQASNQAEPWQYDDEITRFAPFKSAMSQLKRYRVWNPFAEILATELPHDEPATMRLSKEIWSAIKSRTLLYQFQRSTAIINGREYKVSTYGDMAEVLTDCAEMIETCKSGLQTHQIKFYDSVMVHLAPEATYKAIGSKYLKVFKSKIPETSLKRSYIKPLVEYGYLEIDDKHKPHKVIIDCVKKPTSTNIDDFGDNESLAAGSTKTNQDQPIPILVNLSMEVVKDWLDENMAEKLAEYNINHQKLGIHIDKGAK